MKEHIKGLIASLSNYNQKLDKIASFTDKKWVFVDENSNQQTYIFKRDGRLIMSLSGKVKDGSWEYLPEAESILIDRIQDKILLNHAFFDEAVMILKYDGAPNKDLFILADHSRIPDLNVLNYLTTKVETKQIEEVKINTKRKVRIRLNNDQLLEVFTNYTIYSEYIDGFNIGDSVFIEDSSPADGLYVSKSGKLNITIKDGTIIDYFVVYRYNLPNEYKIKIESKQFDLPKNGDLAYDDSGDPATSGKYKIGFMEYITIDNGYFVKRTYW